MTKAQSTWGCRRHVRGDSEYGRGGTVGTARGRGGCTAEFDKCQWLLPAGRDNNNDNHPVLKTASLVTLQRDSAGWMMLVERVLQHGSGHLDSNHKLALTTLRPTLPKHL